MEVARNTAGYVFLGVISCKVVPLDKKIFLKFQQKIEWKGKFSETRLEILKLLRSSIFL